MSVSKKIFIAFLVAIIAGGGIYYFSRSETKTGKQINVNKDPAKESSEPANTGDVSPISGLACSNWNRRPIAVMQPADVPARPAAGFSDADMVIEMPVITATITRLMGVYVCGDPDDVGSMRSARHDFVHLAKGMDAIFVHWGRSDIPEFKDRLNSGIIDNMNCNGDAGKSAVNYCYRKEGMSRGVDSGYAKFSKIIEGAKAFGYRMEGKFSGYPHQAEPATGERGNGGHLRVAFPGPFAAEYDYDKESNTYLRTWGNVADTDRNNGKRHAPKNVVVLMAVSEQIEGQYNNVQLGDPWYDTSDSGEAYYYMNGKEMKGTWKKDKSRIESKLMMLDENGQEVKFVPGQIWVEVLEPGQTLRWTPAA
ncbi:MAG TPA: DUF3048 domain-containing protein [Candidatus Moranbacteria bacterium]|nr:DUF3048 domain-containing protein [Candidatus Moranbacteria bacterium]